VVIGANANAFYRELGQATGKAPQWNFHKYLIDRKGQIVGSYASSVGPQDKRLFSDIEHALNGN
jgi:glutathione peroxidase